MYGRARACQKARGGRQTSECWPPLWSLDSWCQQQTTASPLKTPAPAPPVTNRGENGARPHSLTQNHRWPSARRQLFSCRYIEEPLVIIPNTIYDKHLNTSRRYTYCCFYLCVCVWSHSAVRIIAPHLQLHTHFAVSVTASVCLSNHLFSQASKDEKVITVLPDRWISRVNTHCHGYVDVSPVTRTSERKGDHETWTVCEFRSNPSILIYSLLTHECLT